MLVKTNFKKILIFSVLIIQSSCATKSYKESLYRNMLIGFGAGLIVGQLEKNNKEAYSTMYGASGAALAALYTNYVESPDDKYESLKKTNQSLIEQIENNESGFSDFKRKSIKMKGPATNAVDALPDKFRSMINPGEWSISEIDEWVSGGENQVIHQDMILELKPATLKQK